MVKKKDYKVNSLDSKSVHSNCDTSAQDITLLRRMNARLSLMSDIISRLLISDHPQEIVNDLCNKVMEYLECQVFFNYLVDDKAGKLHLNAYAGIPQDLEKNIEWLDYGVAISGCVARYGRRIIAENIPATKDPRTDLIAGFGIKAYACHPLLSKGGRVIGTLSFGTSLREKFEDDEIALMKSTADYVAIAMERVQYQDALKESENRYRMLFNSLQEGFALHEMIFDEEGRPVDYRFLDVNQGFERLTGLKREDLIGRTVMEVLPDTESYWIETYGKVAMTGEPTSFQNYSSQLGKWYEVYAFSPAAGQFAVLFLDITDRKKTEAEIEQQKDVLIAISENTNTLLACLDRDFNFIWVNQAYAKAAAKEPVDLIGHNHFELYPHEENQAIFERVRDTGEPFEVKEKPFVYPDQPERGITYWDWTLTPVKDSSGQVSSLVLSLTEVTEHVEYVQKKEELLQREHRIAEVLQKALIPKADYDIPGCDIAVRYKPAYKVEIGGDFYDIFDIGDNKLGILIGDVAGKGIDAAISVSAARHSVRSYAYIDPRPGRVLTLANDALCNAPQNEAQMLTAFFAIVDLDVGVISCANGGHEYPMLRRTDGTVDSIEIKGQALGIVGGYDYQDYSLLLRPGDLIVMVTDGITEARKDSRYLFGPEGFRAYLQNKQHYTASMIADGLLDAAETFAGGTLSDDAAIVVFGLI